MPFSFYFVAAEENARRNVTIPNAPRKLPANGRSVVVASRFVCICQFLQNFTQKRVWKLLRVPSRKHHDRESPCCHRHKKCTMSRNNREGGYEYDWLVAREEASYSSFHICWVLLRRARAYVKTIAANIISKIIHFLVL